MTTQPETAVGSESPVETSPEDRLNAAFDVPSNHQEDDEPTEGELPAEEAEDETDIEAEADDLPPIDAPVSWDGEAKAKFAELPRDVQEYVTKRETERERFVQSKSQEATRARQDAEQAAYQQLAQIEQGYAGHYQQLAEQLQPQRPNPALLQHDPVTFYAQQAHYEGTVAQQRELQQLASQHAQQAQQRAREADQAEFAKQHQTIVETFPEYADPTTGPKLQQELSAVARELGYPPELISQARATDILAMRKVAEMKAKADKYDAMMSKKMAGVRAAKALPPTAKPGSARAPGAARQQQYTTDREALRNGDSAATQRVLDSFFTKSK